MYFKKKSANKGSNITVHRSNLI